MSTAGFCSFVLVFTYCVGVPSLQVLDIPSWPGHTNTTAHLQVQKTLINQLQLLVPPWPGHPQVVELIYMVMRQSRPPQRQHRNTQRKQKYIAWSSSALPASHLTWFINMLKRERESMERLDEKRSIQDNLLGKRLQVYRGESSLSMLEGKFIEFKIVLPAAVVTENWWSKYFHFKIGIRVGGHHLGGITNIPGLCKSSADCHRY